MKPSVSLRTTAGLQVRAPADLECVTTYVLLEQGRWFEKEASFVGRCLRPGMTGVDIGANLGLYALGMAAAVGPSGRVIAYEPGADTAALLEESRRLNGAESLQIERRALSDSEREGVLFTSGGGGEGSSLTRPDEAAGSGAPVMITTLDAEQRRLGWTGLDFLKIDAEGEETRIVEGGVQTLSHHSPLVMFEISLADRVDLGAMQALSRLGYAPYRLLGDSSMLVPWDAASADSWELNLFAAKPDRAAVLEAGGLLASAQAPPENPPPGALPGILTAPYLAAFGAGAPGLDPLLLAGFHAHDQWRDPTLPPARRWGALAAALSAFDEAARASPTPARLATLARVAWESGQRMKALETLAEIVARRALPQGEPFLPPHRRFDALDPAGRPLDWFLGSVLEQIERICAHSSYFQKSDPQSLAWLCQNPFASEEMHRRAALQAARLGQPPPRDSLERLPADFRDTLMALSAG